MGFFDASNTLTLGQSKSEPLISPTAMRAAKPASAAAPAAVMNPADAPDPLDEFLNSELQGPVHPRTGTFTAGKYAGKTPGQARELAVAQFKAGRAPQKQMMAGQSPTMAMNSDQWKATFAKPQGNALNPAMAGTDFSGAIASTAEMRGRQAAQDRAAVQSVMPKAPAKIANPAFVASNATEAVSIDPRYGGGVGTATRGPAKPALQAVDTPPMKPRTPKIFA